MLSLKQFLLTYVICVYTKTYIAQAKYVLWPDIERSIAQYKVISTWENAKRHCDSQGGTLASPIDAGLLKHMKAIIGVNNHTTPYFIGIKARDDGKFVSEEGILLEDISEAAIYMVDQIDPRVGDCLCMDQYSIRVVSCWSRLPYMCYKEATSLKNSWTGAETTDGTPTPTDIPTLLDVPILSSNVKMNCDLDNRSGYHLYANGRCYKFHNFEMFPWRNANKTCTEEGGYLASPKDIAEANLIKNIMFSSKYKPTFVWIGLYDLTGNRNWRSVQGDDLRTIYNVTDLKSSRFDCAVMKYTGKIFDRPCGSTHMYICEKTYS